VEVTDESLILAQNFPGRVIKVEKEKWMSHDGLVFDESEIEVIVQLSFPAIGIAYDRVSDAIACAESLVGLQYKNETTLRQTYKDRFSDHQLEFGVYCYYLDMNIPFNFRIKDRIPTAIAFRHGLIIVATVRYNADNSETYEVLVFDIDHDVDGPIDMYTVENFVHGIDAFDDIVFLAMDGGIWSFDSRLFDDKSSSHLTFTKEISINSTFTDVHIGDDNWLYATTANDVVKFKLQTSIGRSDQGMCEKEISEKVKFEWLMWVGFSMCAFLGVCLCYQRLRFQDLKFEYLNRNRTLANANLINGTSGIEYEPYDAFERTLT